MEIQTKISPELLKTASDIWILDQERKTEKIKDNITKYISMIINALLSAIKDNSIDYKVVNVTCEKCNKDAKELQLILKSNIKLLFINLPIRIVMKMFYHDVCGCSYCRFVVV